MSYGLRLLTDYADDGFERGTNAGQPMIRTEEVALIMIRNGTFALMVRTDPAYDDEGSYGLKYGTNTGLRNDEDNDDL